MEKSSQKPEENRANKWLNLSKVFLYIAQAIKIPWNTRLYNTILENSFLATSYNFLQCTHFQ